MTGPEMMLNSLIKLFKLEHYVPVIQAQVKAAVDDGIIDKVKLGVEQIGTLDKRLARIERALGLEPWDTEPGSGADNAADSPDFFSGQPRLQSPQRDDN